MSDISYNDIASMIDHSLLKPYLTDSEIIEGCNVAKKHKVASVCVRPSDVNVAIEILKESDVKVSTVIGFPNGTHTIETKMVETVEAIENGCEELDVVLNIGKLKSGEYEYVQDELKMIITLAHENNVKVKVIFENCYLTDEEKIEACHICNIVKPDWIKTSTGFGTGGAEDDDLILMREEAIPEIQIKAAGGVRTLERAIEVRKLGCTRIGATATVDILSSLK